MSVDTTCQELVSPISRKVIRFALLRYDIPPEIVVGDIGVVLLFEQIGQVIIVETDRPHFDLRRCVVGFYILCSLCGSIFDMVIRASLYGIHISLLSAFEQKSFGATTTFFPSALNRILHQSMHFVCP